MPLLWRTTYTWYTTELHVYICLEYLPRQAAFF